MGNYILDMDLRAKMETNRPSTSAVTLLYRQSQFTVNAMAFNICLMRHLQAQKYFLNHFFSVNVLKLPFSWSFQIAELIKIVHKNLYIKRYLLPKSNQVANLFIAVVAFAAAAVSS